MAAMGTDRLAEGVARRVMAARRGLVRLGIIERLSDEVTRSSLECNAMRAFGIQTLLLILLGIASMSGISVALRDVSDLNGVVRQQRRLIDARIAVIEEGDRLKAYALHPSPATEAAARTAVTQTDERVRLSATAALTSSQENVLRTAGGITASGPADFERLVRAQNALGRIVRDQIYVEGTAIQRSLDDFARKATAASEAGAADKAREASAAYSLVRIAIERFVAQSAPVNAAAAREATLSLEEVLNQLYDSTRNPALLGQADQIIKRLIRYDDAFRTITALTGRRDRLLAGFARRQQVVGDTVNSVGGAVDSVQGGAVTNARLALGGLFTLSIVLGVMAIAFIYIAGLVFRRAVTRPVQRITAQMQRLAKGDLSEQAAFTDRADEVGEMARALEVFRLNAIEVKRLQGEEVERLAARQDADRRAEEERQRLRDEAEDAKRRMLADLAARFENQVARAMDTLSQAAREIDEGARTVALTVNSSQDSARAVTAAAIEASGSTATIAAATEEMNLSLAEVSRQVSETSSFAARAVERVGQTDGIVTTLAHDAAEIGQVVSLVHDIAQQVNLLALNATIEASRAGAAGRGFAVVAAEVKSLAQQTAMATTEIHDRVSSIQNISRSAMQAMDEIRHVIAEMGVLAASVAAAIEQQVHTTAEIARNTTLAAVGTNRVTDDLRRVHEGVAVSGEAAHSARAAAEAVSRQTAALQLEVDAFLQSVRSA